MNLETDQKDHFFYSNPFLAQMNLIMNFLIVNSREKNEIKSNLNSLFTAVTALQPFHGISIS